LVIDTLRTNKRRNLTSSQWAAVAVEAEDIMEVIRAAVEEERRAKISAARTAAVDVVTMELEMGDVATSAGELVVSALDGGEIDREARPDNLLSSLEDEHATKTATKVATMFNTNRQYVNEAKRLKVENPKGCADYLEILEGRAVSVHSPK